MGKSCPDGQAIRFASKANPFPTLSMYGLHHAVRRASPHVMVYSNLEVDRNSFCHLLCCILFFRTRTRTRTRTRNLVLLLCCIAMGYQHRHLLQSRAHTPPSFLSITHSHTRTDTRTHTQPLRLTHTPNIHTHTEHTQTHTHIHTYANTHTRAHTPLGYPDAPSGVLVGSPFSFAPEHVARWKQLRHVCIAGAQEL